MGRLALLLPVLLLAACGGMTTTDNPGGSTPHVPTLHVIYPDTPADLLPAGLAVSYGPFSLPSASVSYTVTERTTTVTNDHWDTGIFSSAELAYLKAGQTGNGYALKNYNSGTASGTASVPADEYNLVVQCRNISDDCVYSYEVSATY